MKEKENPSRCLISLCQCWFSWCFSMKVFTPFFSAGKHGETTEKLYPWKNPKSWCSQGSSFPDWSKRNRGNSRADDWCSETQPRISGRNHRRICCGRYWWGGIIQQYKKVLSRLPEPEERDGEDRILSSKCGMYDGRKIAACDLWAGNAETQRWFRKDEGELTGAKRLIRHLKKRHGHFADVIMADALYLNAPFINTLKECGLETVIRLKDERRLLFQDAESMFQQDEGRKRSFRKGKKSIEV